jgi:hypothetical protein
MKPLFIAASLFATALTFAAVPAMAADDAAACHTLAAQTSSALSAASGDVSEARDEARIGGQACQFGHFQMGVAHFHKALSLLGK